MSTIEQQQQMVFYVPGTMWPVGVAIWLGREYVTSAGQTLAQLQQVKPACELVTFEAALCAMNDAAKLPVQHINKDEYREKLEMLPPLDWQCGVGSSSFKMMEMYSGNITDIYVQVGDEYFKLRDHVTLPHDQIMTRVSAFHQAGLAQVAA
uniref:hypothetical protein n=1 Tax=Serratia proteamaculans TaxID=28151 RepID=UPI001F4C2A11|nr:hypothetical protein [Serratia proteamaculans]ULG13620.1 Sea42 [Serratia proteamaculans]ULG15071.1 Sea42 [Serratia proteamaculans]ULG16286.1 Sea42 [Serratia proteamaculans]ULG19380.1 Sea42 [Serratia proteamaculans]